MNETNILDYGIIIFTNGFNLYMAIVDPEELRLLVLNKDRLIRAKYLLEFKLRVGKIAIPEQDKPVPVALESIPAGFGFLAVDCTINLKQALVYRIVSFKELEQANPELFKQLKDFKL